MDSPGTRGATVCSMEARDSRVHLMSNAYESLLFTKFIQFDILRVNEFSLYVQCLIPY